MIHTGNYYIISKQSTTCVIHKNWKTFSYVSFSYKIQNFILQHFLKGINLEINKEHFMIHLLFFRTYATNGRCVYLLHRLKVDGWSTKQKKSTYVLESIHRSMFSFSYQRTISKISSLGRFDSLKNYHIPFTMARTSSTTFVIGFVVRASR